MMRLYITANSDLSIDPDISMATILERSKISPSPGAPPELSVPLVFFDMVWYGFHANQSLLLFDFPCSKTHFLNSIVPRLKKSLSLTLTHFFPLAGNIIHPLNPRDDDKPVLRYQSSTDSVSFTVSESDADFSYLAGNEPRNCDEFYPLTPLLPRAARSDTSISCPVLALQVTLFPGKGLSIGFIIHHAVADASTLVSFIRAWALINRIGADDNKTSALRLTEANLLPFLDRKTVTNINGLDSIYWDIIVKESCSGEPLPPLQLPINKLRATFVLKREEIEKLKSVVRANAKAKIPHISSFTVACALIWACHAKSAGEDEAAEEPEYFGFQVDCRGRLKPPLPASYLGNCVALAAVELKHGQVKGADGFVTAAKAVGKAVEGILKNDNGVVDGAENWPEMYRKMAGKRQYGLGGSPRFDIYAADFGWGKARKYEMVSTDYGGISLWKSRDFEGAIEIGMSKSDPEMDAFATVFNRSLADLLRQPSFVSRY